VVCLFRRALRGEFICETAMPLLILEHSPTAYRLDFAIYAGVSVALATALLVASPTGSGALLTACALGGLLAWSPVEYGLHRFVLHRLRPFSAWHDEHHRRPTALIGSPTWITLTLFATLVAAPAAWLLGAWPACALTFGLLTGYLGYGLTHHATHHAVPAFSRRNAWLSRRRRWHALHHQAHRAKPGDAQAAAALQPGHYGVSSALWDHVFRTAG
jgi:cyclopropane-fatty-acyl-phospholipid synthase